MEKEMIVNQTAFMADYSRGMEILKLTSPAFSRFVAGLGYPIADPNIPTAQVQVSRGSKAIEFHINPDLLTKLKDSEIAVVIAHESLHVILCHLSELQDKEKFPRQDVLTEAHECIINDSIPSNLGLPLMDWIVTGKKYNQDFSFFSSQEAYDFILSKENDENNDEDRGQNSSQSSGRPAGQNSSDSDSQKGDDQASPSTPMDMHGGQPAITFVDDQEEQTSSSDDDSRDSFNKAMEKAMDQVEDASKLPSVVQDAIQDLVDSGTISAPSYGVGEPKTGFQNLSSLGHINANYKKLLSAINPAMKHYGTRQTKDYWNEPRRRMLHSYPLVVLPSSKVPPRGGNRRGAGIPAFVIALDMSVSIPTHLLGNLAEFAKAAPKELIRSFPITWSDGYRVFDPAEPMKIVQRGGTNLSAVMNYVKTVERDYRVKPYVLVITDGNYRLPGNITNDPSVSKRWYWMGIQDSDRQTITSSTSAVASNSHILSLNDFC